MVAGDSDTETGYSMLPQLVLDDKLTRQLYFKLVTDEPEGGKSYFIDKSNKKLNVSGKNIF